MSRLCFSFAVLTVLAADAAQEDALKKELEKLSGTWAQTGGEVNGQKLPEDAYKNAKFTVKGDKWTYLNGNQVFEGTWKVDPSKKPKTFDAVSTTEPNKGKSMLGIYELEGDMLKLCLAQPDKERPKGFATVANSGLSMLTMKKEKTPGGEK